MTADHKPHSEQLKVTENVYELLVQEKHRRRDLEEQLAIEEQERADFEASQARLLEQLQSAEEARARLSAQVDELEESESRLLEQLEALATAARFYRAHVSPHLDDEYEVGAAEDLDHCLSEAGYPYRTDSFPAKERP